MPFSQMQTRYVKNHLHPTPPTIRTSLDPQWAIARSETENYSVRGSQFSLTDIHQALELSC